MNGSWNCSQTCALTSQSCSVRTRAQGNQNTVDHPHEDNECLCTVKRSGKNEDACCLHICSEPHNHMVDLRLASKSAHHVKSCLWSALTIVSGKRLLRVAPSYQSRHNHGIPSNFKYYIQKPILNVLTCYSEWQHYIKIFLEYFLVMGRSLSVMGSCDRCSRTEACTSATVICESLDYRFQILSPETFQNYCLEIFGCNEITSVTQRFPGISFVILRSRW